MNKTIGRREKKNAPITLRVLNYSSLELELLKKVALEVLTKSSKTPTFGSETRLKEYFAGRAALSLLLREIKLTRYINVENNFGYLNLVDSTHKIQDEEYISLSHTDEITVAAFASCPVGVDIESLDRNATAVMKRVTNPAEKKWFAKKQIMMRGMQVEPSNFLWSAKESYAKALGIGMRKGFQDLIVNFSEAPPYRVQTLLRGPLTLRSPIIEVDFYKKYLITICSEETLLGLGVDRGIFDIGLIKREFRQYDGS